MQIALLNISLMATPVPFRVTWEVTPPYLFGFASLSGGFVLESAKS